MTASSQHTVVNSYKKKLTQVNTLLVEDDLLNAKLVSVLFSQNGLKLQIAAHGAEAIEKLKDKDYDILLMDMEMPVMNGYQATSIIRQVLKKNTPIIALTGHILRSEKEKCLAYGMNDYLAKPIDPELLFESMYNLTCIKKNAVPRLSSQKNTIPVLMPNQVCNMGYLVGATRGNKKMMNNIVAVFFKETKKELTFLNEAIKKTNYPAISHVSHKIKSAFSILGISVLEPVFNEMEQLSSVTSPIEKIEQLNRRVNIVFKQAREEMKAMY